MTDWLHTIFDASAGGVIGALGAFFAAVLVVKRQSKSDRELARLERRVAAAMTIYPMLEGMRITLLEARVSPNKPEIVPEDKVKILVACTVVLDQLMLAFVPAGAVSPYISQRLHMVFNALSEARAEMLPTDDIGTEVRKYVVGFEKAESELQSVLIHITQILERDGDVPPP